jgi:hypothetical protein
MEDSVLSPTQSQGSHEGDYTHNAIKRMNRLENKINVKDSITMDSAYGGK